jgi:hypothetical protein
MHPTQIEIIAMIAFSLFAIFKNLILNLLGATFRWTFGTIWRKLGNYPTFTIGDYLRGAKQIDPSLCKWDHEALNKLLGMFTLGCFFMIAMVLNNIFSR